MSVEDNVNYRRLLLALLLTLFSLGGAWAEGHGLRGEGRGEHRGAVCAGGPPHVEAHPSIRPAARTYHVHTTHIIYHAHADRPAACAAAGARWAAVC